MKEYEKVKLRDLISMVYLDAYKMGTLNAEIVDLHGVVETYLEAYLKDEM